MSRNQKLFLIILGLYTVFDFILGSLLGIYIWSETKSTSAILWYYLTLFTMIMVTSQYAKNIIKYWGAKRVYQLAICIGIMQIGVVVLLRSLLAEYMWIIAVLSGMSIGLQSVSYGMVIAAITNENDSARYISLKSATMNIVSIITIPTIAYLVRTTGSYATTYYIAGSVGILIITIISMLNMQNIQEREAQKLEVSKVWLETSGKTFLISRLLFGLFNAPIWAILGLVTYQFVGNITTWGILTTIFTLFQIVGSHYYGKINNADYHRVGAVVATLMFSLTAIILGTNWNLSTFLLYQLGLVMLNITFSIYYEKRIYTVLQRVEYKDRQEQLISMGEVFLGFGRLLVLLILIITGFSIDNLNMMKLVFVCIASIPLVLLSILPSERTTT